MSRFSLFAFALPFACGACHTNTAPEELSELSTFLYRVWSSPNERDRQDGLRNLYAHLQGIDDLANAPLNDRSWEIQALSEQDVADIKRPDRPLEDTTNVSVAYASPWPVTDHARVQTLADQTPVEPTSPDYVRTFLDPTDPSCFPDADCETLYTTNDLVRKNVLFEVRITLLKDFRWVEWKDEDGDLRRAFYSRSWIEQPWPGKKNNVWIQQSYSIDVWFDVGDDTTWRYQTLWSESDLGLSVDRALEAATVKGGTNDIFKAGDKAIEQLYHSDGQ